MSESVGISNDDAIEMIYLARLGALEDFLLSKFPDSKKELEALFLTNFKRCQQEKADNNYFIDALTYSD